MKYVLSFLFALSALFLHAEEKTAEYLDAASFLDYVGKNAYDFIGNEEKLTQYRESYLQSRALLYPNIQGTVSGSFSDTLHDLTRSGIKTENQSANTVSPELSVSQLLPSAGVLRASVRDNLTLVDPGSIGGFTVAPYWGNKIDFSLNLAQPVYFKNAFRASLDLLKFSNDNNTIAYRENRNALFVQALSDFAGLSQALYSRELVENRLAADRESFSRLEKEFAMGLWTKSVLAVARASLLKSESDFLRADNSFRESLASFALIYNLGTPPSVASTVEELEVDAVLIADAGTAISAGNPSLSRLANSLAMLESSLIIYEKDNAPTLNAGVNYSTTTAVEKNEAENRTLSGSISLSARLADGGEYVHGRAAKKSEISGTEKSLALARGRALSQGRNLAFAISLAEKNKEYYRSLVESAAYEYEKGVKESELGQITGKQLTELKLAQENAKLALQQNIIEKNTAYLNLLSLMGKDIASFLQNKK